MPKASIEVVTLNGHHHTPGPWRVGCGFGTGECAIYAEAFEGGRINHHLAQANLPAKYERGGHSKGSFDEAQANALLIAAAPQLLKACYKTEAVLTELMNASPANEKLRAFIQETWDEVHHAYMRAVSREYAEVNPLDGDEKSTLGNRYR